MREAYRLNKIKRFIPLHFIGNVGCFQIKNNISTKDNKLINNGSYYPTENLQFLNGGDLETAPNVFEQDPLSGELTKFLIL